MTEKKELRIAFFTVDWNYELVENTFHGLKRYTDEHVNVRAYTFDCFGKDQGFKRDQSEYAVFDLPDLRQFDGVMIQGNQIVLQSARDRIAERVANSGIPAVSFGCPLPGCTMITYDNRAAQHDLTDHLIRVHGARKLVYLTGIMNNRSPEAEKRLQGFMDACRENGIQDNQTEIIECTWRTADGANVARKWIADERKLPDAFVCANDEMALGLMDVLLEAGIRIPQDVMVTGFDDLSSAQLSSPRLSSVRIDQADINYFGMNILIDKINGKEYPDTVEFQHRVIHSESCGCMSTERPNKVRDMYFRQTRFLKNFYQQQDQMAEELFEAEDLPDLMRIIGRNHRIFGCDRIYLCINDYYYDNYDKTKWKHDSERFSDQMVFFAENKNERQDPRNPVIRFPRSDLLPENLIRHERFLIFYPLHYNTYSIGYIALNGISNAAKLNLHESIFSFLEIAIENVRKKMLLHNMNSVLDDLYVHDGLTGLYNRFGFSRYGQSVFDGLMEKYSCVQVVFIDMNDMKMVNDYYGHDAGDSALKGTAEILRKSCTSEAFIMRYGGDEFFVIDNGCSEHLVERIARETDAFNARSGFPFTLSLSFGTVRTIAAEKRSIIDCLQEADSLMYEMKAEFKKTQIVPTKPVNGISDG